MAISIASPTSSSEVMRRQGNHTRAEIEAYTRDHADRYGSMISRATSADIAEIAGEIDRHWLAPRDIELVRRFLAATLPPGRIFIHAAGTHTEAILDTLRARSDIELLGIIDKATVAGAERFGLPLITAKEAVAQEFDYVLLSHPRFEAQMRHALDQAGVPAGKVWPIYANPDYLAFASAAFDEVALPERADTVIVTFTLPQNQILTDAEVIELFPDGPIIRLSMGTPATFKPSPLFPVVNLYESGQWLAQAIERLQPARIIIRTAFQAAPTPWPAWLRWRFPNSFLILEIYDWMFGVPEEQLISQYLADPADVDSMRRAEMISVAAADIVIDKWGGSYWRRFTKYFRDKSVFLFPAVGAIEGSHSKPMPQPRTPGTPIRVVHAGGLHAPAVTHEYCPVKHFIGAAEDLVASGRITLDIYNGMDLPPAGEQLFAEYRSKYTAPPLHYHPAIPLADVERTLQNFDFAQIFVTTGLQAVRFMDISALGNRFMSYVAGGLPTISSDNDVFSAFLIRHFKAGITLRFDELASLPDRLAEADIAELRRGVDKLCRFMQRSNRRKQRRLTELCQKASTRGSSA